MSLNLSSLEQLHCSVPQARGSLAWEPYVALGFVLGCRNMERQWIDSSLSGGFAFFIVTQSSLCPVVSLLWADVLLCLAILFIMSVLDFAVCQNNTDIWRAVILQIHHTLLWNSRLCHEFVLVRVWICNFGICTKTQAGEWREATGPGPHPNEFLRDHIKPENVFAFITGEQLQNDLK